MKTNDVMQRTNPGRRSLLLHPDLIDAIQISDSSLSLEHRDDLDVEKGKWPTEQVDAITSFVVSQAESWDAGKITEQMMRKGIRMSTNRTFSTVRHVLLTFVELMKRNDYLDAREEEQVSTYKINRKLWLKLTDIAISLPFDSK